MHQINGVWLPLTDNGQWLRKHPVVDGEVRYQYDRIEACVSLCQHHGRTRVALDGGAHIGLWSIHLAKHFDSVLAFEPVPKNFECLQHNLQPYAHKVDLHQAALGLTKGNVLMTPRVSDEGSIKSITWRADIGGNAHTHVAACINIDSLQLPVLDLLKLDIEGSEHAALIGAQETLLRCRPVVIVEDKHDPHKRALEYLTQLGMVLHIHVRHDYLFLWRTP